MKIEIQIPKITLRHIVAGISLAWSGTLVFALSSWLWNFIYRGIPFPDMSEGRWGAFLAASFIGSVVFGTTLDKSMWK